MTSEIEREIRAFVTENFLFRDDRPPLADDESLIEAGLIDSMGILELVAFLESRFGLQVADSEIVPANMDSIRAIAAYVQAKLAVPQAA